VWRLFVRGGCGSQQKPRGDFPSRDFCYSGHERPRPLAS
jgi:hypothetical protein